MSNHPGGLEDAEEENRESSIKGDGTKLQESFMKSGIVGAWRSGQRIMPEYSNITKRWFRVTSSSSDYKFKKKSKVLSLIWNQRSCLCSEPKLVLESEGCATWMIEWLRKKVLCWDNLVPRGTMWRSLIIQVFVCRGKDFIFNSWFNMEPKKRS